MKTTILDELDIPDDRRAALSREALRRGMPVAMLIRNKLLELADSVTGAHPPKPQPQQQKAA